MIAQTPKPPYYAVIFTSVRTEIDNGYSEMADFLEETAKHQEGYLGIESAKEQIGITVSYWKDIESIAKWKQHTDHITAQNKGRAEWYSQYKTRICKVERDYGFNF